MPSAYPEFSLQSIGPSHAAPLLMGCVEGVKISWEANAARSSESSTDTQERTLSVDKDQGCLLPLHVSRKVGAKSHDPVSFGLGM